jgi:DNA modification methylase
MAPADNLLFYGDNLDVLGRHIRDESVDLVYLDPPFNSNADYNVLFAEKDGTQAAGQMQAFEDTWRWDEAAARVFAETVEQGGRVADVLLAFERFLGTNDMLAYLAMMAPRLVELRRVLKPTGSLYLHCDPTASHYLKLLLDAVFGPENFRSEIIWRRTSGHNKVSRQYGPIHDTLLFYAKGEDCYFKPGMTPVARGYIREWFTGEDERGPFRTNMLTGPGTRTGSSGKPWRKFDPTSVGRHWAIPKSISHALPAAAADWTTQQSLDFLYDAGFIYIPKDGEGQPKYKQYISGGIPYQDVWAYQPYTQGCLYGTEEAIDEDVKWLQHDQERLGYPTQKPEGLLVRVIESSCPPEGIVLDPFCGCGTTISAAHRLDRRWIGIDVTHLAIGLIKTRLRDAFGDMARYQVIGEPTTVEDAAALAESDKYQFQWWALGLVGARPVEQKKGADKGIDGRLYFHDGSKETRSIILSVKGGNLKATDVRDLRGVLDREKAEMGVLLSFEPPTQPMRTEAASAGFYTSPWGKHQRIQLLTVADLLGGKGIDYPRTAGTNQTYKQAPRAARMVAERIVTEPTRDVFGSLEVPEKVKKPGRDPKTPKPS